jgi:hypothetical protein
MILIAGACWLFVGVAHLIGAMICTLIINDFNPHHEVKTFTLIMGIVGALWLIRKIIGTEPKDDVIFSDCNTCEATDSEKEIIKSAITEEMFNEAIRELNHDDRNETM